MTETELSLAAATNGAVLLSPRDLFACFRRGNDRESLNLLAQFRALPDKKEFFQPAVELFRTEEDDRVRAWSTTVLELIGGRRAFGLLLTFLEEPATEETKHSYRYTRFFALVALARLERSDRERDQVTALLDTLWQSRWQDTEEDYLVQALAAVLLAQRGRHEPRAQVRAMLGADDDFWITWACLRALREFQLPETADDVAEIMRRGRYIDHRFFAVRALAKYRENPAVVYELSNVVRTSGDSFLRQAAVGALAELGNREAEDALVGALVDADAETRVQAASALQSLLSKQEAVSVVVQRALGDGADGPTVGYLLDALRRIDGALSAEVLNRELGSQDRRRAQAAEEILVNLGGWAAVQRLGQRRSTLDSLDEILKQSEEVVRTTFADTIRQARRNFYFAMIVNGLVVATGMALIVLAIVQLVQNPGQLERWILPGSAGVIGVLVNLLFNNPRQNAREDLTALMNVNVIFLAFLRQLNEIDATFKHAYIESHTFGANDMRASVGEITSAVEQALNMAEQHLSQQRAQRRTADGADGRATSRRSRADSAPPSA